MWEKGGIFVAQDLYYVGFSSLTMFEDFANSYIAVFFVIVKGPGAV